MRRRRLCWRDRSPTRPQPTARITPRLCRCARRTLYAKCLFHLGRLDETLEMERGIYSARCRTLGPEDPETLISLENLATTHHTLCHYERAAELRERAYDARKRTDGPQAQTTLSTLGHLGLSHQALGHHKRAVELLEQTYAGRKATLGGGHPTTLIALSNLALTLHLDGQLQRSQALQEQLLEVTKTHAAQHPGAFSYSNVLNNLAGLFEKRGEYMQAAALYEQAIAQAQSDPAADTNGEVLTSRNNLASCLLNMGEVERALPLLQQVHEGQSATRGAHHHLTLISLNNLAEAHLQAGKTRKAIELFTQTHTWLLATLGPDHPDTRLVERNLANSKAVFNRGHRRPRHAADGAAAGRGQRGDGGKQPAAPVAAAAATASASCGCRAVAAGGPDAEKPKQKKVGRNQPCPW